MNKPLYSDKKGTHDQKVCSVSLLQPNTAFYLTRQVVPDTKVSFSNLLHIGKPAHLFSKVWWNPSSTSSRGRPTGPTQICPLGISQALTAIGPHGLTRPSGQEQHMPTRHRPSRPKSQGPAAKYYRCPHGISQALTAIGPHGPSHKAQRPRTTDAHTADYRPSRPWPTCTRVSQYPIRPAWPIP